MILTKVISGGQTGADIGGLIAADWFGIDTGGTMPKGFLTLDGTSPWMAKKFGMKESLSPGYQARTEANVVDSDGTIRFARNFSSPGEKCTVRYIRQYLKPCCDVDIASPTPHKQVATWILVNNIKVLNVAGNSETTSPGIRDFVEEYLGIVFDILKNYEGTGKI